MSSRIKTLYYVVCLVGLLFFLSSCQKSNSETMKEPRDTMSSSEQRTDAVIETNSIMKEEESKMEVESQLQLLIDGEIIPVNWEDNEAVNALYALVKDSTLTVNMSMYGGFEQVGSLGSSLPRDDKQITTHTGDIVLYSGNQIVLFYGSNSWAYTKLGKIDLDKDEVISILSKKNVVIEIK